MNAQAGLAPICLFTYNRLSHTRQVIQALEANTLAQKSDLYIFSDGPKLEKDRAPIEVLREYLDEVSGFKSVTVFKQDVNLGLANNIINGVSRVLEEYTNVIVLEDDLVTSSKFLTYMNDALNKYKKNNNVASIHAYSYPLKRPMLEEYFIVGSDCWGWATWRDQWQTFETDGKVLMSRLMLSGRMKQFNLDDCADYSAMLEAQIKGENNSWAVR